MIRIAIDQDGDGAFAVITRPGSAAERVELTHRDAVRLMSEAAQVVLMEEGRRRAQFGGGQPVAGADKTRVVVADVRFPNELDAIRALGGVVIEITTAAAANPATLQHVSEQGGLDWDFSIINPMGPSFFGSLDLLVGEPCRPMEASLIGAMGE